MPGEIVRGGGIEAKTDLMVNEKLGFKEDSVIEEIGCLRLLVPGVVGFDEEPGDFLEGGVVATGFGGFEESGIFGDGSGEVPGVPEEGGVLAASISGLVFEDGAEEVAAGDEGLLELECLAREGELEFPIRNGSRREGIRGVGHGRGLLGQCLTTVRETTIPVWKAHQRPGE